MKRYTNLIFALSFLACSSDKLTSPETAIPTKFVSTVEQAVVDNSHTTQTLPIVWANVCGWGDLTGLVTIRTKTQTRNSDGVEVVREHQIQHGALADVVGHGFIFHAKSSYVQVMQMADGSYEVTSRTEYHVVSKGPSANQRVTVILGLRYKDGIFTVLFTYVDSCM
ncbi:MAG: hypothetical protein A2741_00100 [Candidatus Zambryskibacteria bacterium RIFCSPHIGHO2_01_FULL_43_27]|uniref:Uncharacterized protein n=1 Tax=Candidatus Zambryskibacteria bacterium RIFCSPLOWO2_01_FULL_43_17 TaxID=1802760 RepID=A0A1G2U5K4_9BACT|nr:MAG: hypothetical protein A2741_00100 [Candidatus Zambryskibacteria bacterium RIFCSPHIGHO2_01_FULL_43_27]OHA99487.1 MAG: hypothetical protein A3E93_02825 [Candidatus Zambryskibacteria bacterium RIFCSPHIGHO2_12_FULL_43_12b]OHB04771.1 MAG: hypothetical protein A2920_00690 [Candidatus Zambryskibacteria bacterium RIFCSPLOWO2_01_FULL_43_17]